MEVVNPRAALLSNFEVLELLREQRADIFVRQKTLERIKQEEKDPLAQKTHGLNPPSTVEIPENLNTIEVEAMKYLASTEQPTHRQSAKGISKLLKHLNTFELTKGEKLQIVNLAPMQTVELYVIVDELEDRFGDSCDGILERVAKSLSDTPTTDDISTLTQNGNKKVNGSTHSQKDYPMADEQVYEEDDFLDDGEGAGVEGDLDVDDE